VFPKETTRFFVGIVNQSLDERRKEDGQVIQLCFTLNISKGQPFQGPQTLFRKFEGLCPKDEQD